MSRFRFAGAPAALLDVTVSDREGRPFTLASLRGRTVLVNFWASWCPPCREEMASLAALGRRLEDEGLSVIAVSIDRQPADALRFLDQPGLDGLSVYFDAGARAAEALAARGVPVSILLDPDGREIGRFSGAADWSSGEAILLVRAALHGRLRPADP